MIIGILKIPHVLLMLMAELHGFSVPFTKAPLPTKHWRRSFPIFAAAVTVINTINGITLLEIKSDSTSAVGM